MLQKRRKSAINTQARAPKKMLRFNPHFFYRKKTYNYEETQLSKVLSLFDLTALGVSCTLGSGIYVIAG